jgi:hypothetical protein
MRPPSNAEIPERSQHPTAYFVTFAEEYTNIEGLLLIRQKDSDVPTSLSIL